MSSKTEVAKASTEMRERGALKGEIEADYINRLL